jgi:ADP-L-glycero-D-manno-heptose 6-epimerase
VGLRYFNVYGPGESHKGRMASMVYQLFGQFQRQGYVQLFSGTGGYADGEQRRDFISVRDAVAATMHFLSACRSGIYNVGTGHSASFNELAMAVVNACRRHEGHSPLALEQLQAQGLIRYIPFPAQLEGKYQSFTRADVTALRASGFRRECEPAPAGVADYALQLFRDPDRSDNVAGDHHEWRPRAATTRGAV